MKKLIIITLSFIFGCATGVSGLLRFQDRELLIHPDQSGLAYPYNEEVCENRTGLGRILGRQKCKMVHKIDFYDLNDKATREKLINGGFTCKSKMRFKY